jgi:hypothetical protein
MILGFQGGKKISKHIRSHEIKMVVLKYPKRAPKVQKKLEVH